MPRVSLSVMAAMSLAGCASAAGDEATVTLAITGAQGARVSGPCVVTTPRGEERVDLDTAVPFERRWQASGLRCDLKAQGQVTVDATAGGSRSHSSTSGGRIVIDVR